MPLSAECENCFQPYSNLPDSALGKTFKCKECGSPVRVTRPRPQAELPPAALPVSKTAQRKATAGKQASSSGGGLSLIAIVGILGGVIVFGLVAFAFIAPLLPQPPLPPLDEDYMAEGSADEPTGETGHDAVAGDSSVVSDSREMVNVVADASDQAPADSSPKAATPDLSRKRPALIEAYQRNERTKYIATLIEKMTDPEVAAIADQLLLSAPLRLSTALMMVPNGFDLNDDNTLAERQKLVLKKFNQRDDTKPYAGPVERMTIDEYREWEREMCKPQLESIRNTLTRPPFGIRDLKREQITFTDNGFELPAGIRERFMESLRMQVERELARAEKKVTDYGKLPFWAPLEITPPEEPISWEVSLRGTPKLTNEPDRYVTSIVPSPFITGGLSGFNKGQLRAFDIRNGESIGELAVPIENGDLLLAPDGRHMVLEKTMPGVGKDFLVYSLETGQLVRTINSPTAFVVSWSGMVSPYHLVTFESAESSSTEPSKIRIYDIDTGEKLREFDYTGVTFDDMMTVSPDGRYIARLTHGFEIDLFDLELGRPIAQKSLDRLPSLNLESLAFSHSGEQLAVLGRDIYDKTYIRVLNSESGQNAAEFWLPGDCSGYVDFSASYKGPDLAWFPDDSALWLAGGSVVDIEREIELVRYVPDPAPGSRIASISHGLRIPAQDGVVVLDGSDQGQIAFLPIDFESLRAVADTDIDSLLLAAGDEVEVDIAFKGVDVPDGGIETLEDALTEALEIRGFTVVEEAPIAFRLSPGQAEKRPGLNGQLPTKWSFEAEWVDTETNRSLWETELTASLATAVAASLGSDTQSPVDKVARQLTGAIKEGPIPHTITGDGKEFLPAVGKLKSTSRRRR